MAYAPGWRATALAGVLVRTLERHPDDRGSLTELWRRSWTVEAMGGGVRQANLSRSRAGVLRGMHLHLHQTDVWIVLDGRATVGLADLRPATDGAPETTDVLVLDARPGTAILIPPRVAHGLYVHQDIDLLYLVSSEYDGTDEFGFLWDDPQVGIPWPTGEPVVSMRDRTAPRLANLLERLPPTG